MRARCRRLATEDYRRDPTNWSDAALKRTTPMEAAMTPRIPRNHSVILTAMMHLHSKERCTSMYPPGQGLQHVPRHNNVVSSSR